MPIATKQHSTILEESCNFSFLPQDDDQLLNFPELDLEYFKEIDEMKRMVEKLLKEEKEYRKKAEDLSVALNKAEETIQKAQEKKEALLKRTDFLESCLNKQQERIRNAVQYWKDYGLDVKQISTESDPFEHYEFKFSKLPPKKAPIVLNGQSGDNNTTAQLNQSMRTSTTCIIGLKHHNKQLEIVDQVPELISSEALKELNTRLTEGQCLNKENGHVDWRLAMLMIRKDLIKALNSTRASSSTTTVSATPLASEPEIQSKTCEHPPAETSSHTYT